MINIKQKIVNKNRSQAVVSPLRELHRMIDWNWVYNYRAVKKPKIPKQKPFMPKNLKNLLKKFHVSFLLRAHARTQNFFPIFDRRNKAPLGRYKLSLPY